MVWLFVYGTLKRAVRRSNARIPAVLESAKLVGPAVTNGSLYNVSWFPAMIQSSTPSPVLGEVYDLSGDESEIFRVLDEYEGTEYDRLQVPIKLLKNKEYSSGAWRSANVNASSHSAWVYIWNLPVESLQPIPSGDFAAFKSVPPDNYSDLEDDNDFDDE
eukprot:GILI01031492.1.p1 GENE.GILI01031492.1~~GILI01031492.1.p1  ORF type:complete len:160 (-),score=21.02 GILI01031492.1:33-512(-)